MTNETGQGLERLSWLPDRDGAENGLFIAGQKYYDVYFTGGEISGVTISSLASPLAIPSGGTGQSTANNALNALLPSQTGNSGKTLKTDGANTSWSTDTDTGITQLTGDVTAGPGSGSQAATLATVNSNVGTFGSSTSIPTFAVNAKGLVTAASGNVVIAPAGTLTGATLAAGVTGSSLTSLGTLSSLTVGGAVTLGANSITMTGSIAATGARVTKGWFTDIESTNAPTIGGISASGTGGLVRTTSPTFITGITAPQITFNSTSGIIGTATNDSAAAGSVGEYISASNSGGTALSTGVSTNIASISLTAGDWDVVGNFTLGQAASTVIAFYYSGISLVSGSLPGFFAGANIATPVGASANSVCFAVPTTRISIASTTTVYLVADVGFSISTAAGFGFIGARRVR